MIGAFVYLILCSTRNRVLAQVKRVRNPRYAIALLLGIGYFWLVFFRRGATTGRDRMPPVVGGTLGSLLPVMLLLLAAYTWIFGADGSALAFSEAEVTMLFSAPVSRRGLILYKLARAQAAVLTTSLIWTVLFRRGNAGFAGIVSYWVFLSTLNLHRLGVALIRASASAHGAKGFRRSVPAIAVFGVACAIVVTQLVALRTPVANAADLSAATQLVISAFASPPMSWVLYPFRVVVAPMFASGTAWIRAIIPALVLVALHVWWVLRTESAFEEAAAEASATQAKRIAALRARGISGAAMKATTAKRTLRLRPTGAPAVALLWKNYLWLTRTGQLRTLIGLPLIAAVCAVAFAGRSEFAEILVGVLCASMIVMTLVFGPMTIRNDLRGELLRLPMLKTLPLTGRQIILAEVASSASPTAATQFLYVAVGLLAMGFFPKEMLTVGERIGILIAAPALLLGLNLANFTIHNGMALLFPAWVRLGESAPGGIEATGQMMLTLLVTMVMLLAMLILPALLGAATFFVMKGVLVAALAVAGIVSGVALLVESYLLMVMLGGSLERLEPMQVG